MKLFRIVSTSLLVLNVFLYIEASPVFATVASEATSRNTVKLVGNDTGPTNPVDPTNPEDPNPIDPIDPANPGTGNQGPLSIDFVSNIYFGQQKISARTEVYHALNETPFVQVTDKTGSGNGWTLTAQTTEFTSENQSKVLKGAELSFLNGKINVNSSNVSKMPKATQSVVFTNQDAKEIMNAEIGAGNGTWIDVWSGVANNNENVRLKVLPGSAEAISYHATITWTVTSGPTAS